MHSLKDWIEMGGYYAQKPFHILGNRLKYHVGPCKEKNTNDIEVQPPKWFKTDLLIRHAGGGIDNLRYLNCREAVENSLLHGYRVLEIDFTITEDGEVVCLHEFENIDVKLDKFIYLDFMNCKICGKYTPIDLKGILRFMEEYPDLYIVTDSKEDDNIGLINVLVSQVCAMGKEQLLDRMIPQLYYFDEYEAVKRIYPFKEYIFTLYKSGLYIWDYERIIDFCSRTTVKNVTVPGYQIRDRKAYRKMCDAGIRIFCHTENDPEIIKWIRSYGVSAIYTDFL